MEVLSTNYKEFFSDIVANPAGVSSMHAPQLKALVELYPQSAILRAMLARAIQVTDQVGFQQRLKSAAVYAPDRAILYNLINYPEKLVKKYEQAGVVEQEDAPLVYEAEPSVEPQSEVETFAAPIEEEEPVNYFHESEVLEEPEEAYQNDDIALAEAQPQYEAVYFNDAAKTEAVPGAEEQPEMLPGDVAYPAYTPQQETVTEEPAPVAYDTLNKASNNNAPVSSEIDDEVYDEITGIEDIYGEIAGGQNVTAPAISYPVEPTEPVVDANQQLEDILLAQYGAVVSDSQITTDEPQPYNNVAERPIEPSAAEAEETYTFSPSRFRDKMALASDEVDFEMVSTTPDEKQVEAQAEPTPEPIAPVESNITHVTTQFADDDSRMAKYDDDSLPYSFMWWLNKTRKEHADTHQPYAPKPIVQPQTAPVPDKLQQQYFENIFNLTSVEQLDINTRSKRKGGEIIDRFIEKDPQLKPPNTEKLDNENKAKRSSEDKSSLVSETLASIYADQMLYAKAIAAYQKLLLKFPEKSSYFVAQIELLEKKIN